MNKNAIKQVLELSKFIKNNGFEVYLSKSNIFPVPYGFYTDGKRCINFSFDRMTGQFKFSTSYNSTNDGTGAQLDDLYASEISKDSLDNMINKPLGTWVSGEWKIGTVKGFTTPAELLSKYEASNYYKI